MKLPNIKQDVRLITWNQDSVLISVWQKQIMPLGVSVRYCSDCAKVFSYYAVNNSKLCLDCRKILTSHHTKWLAGEFVRDTGQRRTCIQIMLRDARLVMSIYGMME